MTAASESVAAVFRSRPWLRAAGPITVLSVLLLLAPSTLDGYGIGLLSKALALGVLAVSVSVLAGYAGLPTMGQAAPFLVGAYTAGIMGQHGHDLGVVQLLCGTAAAAGFAAVTGLVATRTRGVAFLMTTLAIGELAVAVAGQWRSLTGGTDGMYGIPPVRPVPGVRALGSDSDIYWYVLAATAAVVALTWRVLASPVGKLLVAARDHEARMRSAGHPVARYRWLAYTGAGALAGYGGVLMCTVNQYVSPADGGFATSALVLLAVVLGGATSPLGALLGAGLIVATRDWLSGPFPGHGPLLLGLMFIIAVYALPDGVAGLRIRLPGRGKGAA
ncbi:branched-chain amino acid ABC transporter permease [Catenulispora yoronensis]|uniref:Branched-chain amino acid ABC transporter permease n=1 Tax=Catenulispora yoronensis TaxID=450799 RepID=A0ABN2V4G9_9ACTN